MNKIVLITGATSGIGYYLAQHLATKGYKVLIIGLVDAEVKDAVASLSKIGVVDGFSVDLSDK